MADSLKKLWLKGQAEEDLYFAKRDRELIEALHKKKLRKKLDNANKKERLKAKKYEKRFTEITERHGDKPKKLGKALSKLIKKIKKWLSRVLKGA
jgi:predicted nucleic acid-binding protein